MNKYTVNHRKTMTKKKQINITHARQGTQDTNQRHKEPRTNKHLNQQKITSTKKHTE